MKWMPWAETDLIRGIRLAWKDAPGKGQGKSWRQTDDALAVSADLSSCPDSCRALLPLEDAKAGRIWAPFCGPIWRYETLSAEEVWREADLDPGRERG